MSTDSSSSHLTAVVDATSIRISDLEKLNTRIRKQILSYGSLNDSERRGVRSSLREALSLADDI